ncbi:MAG TPA: hypothetical protein VEK15_18200 [Vicinamibacteria bacterium]|nr:hypothetical protein [Vicinamibacteria bacterium]
MSPRPFWLAAASILLITIALEIVFSHLAHTEFPWHRFPSFDFVYGLLGCAVIVLVSKWLGHAFLQRDENYYDEEEN